jgi:hypothetical protein
LALANSFLLYIAHPDTLLWLYKGEEELVKLLLCYRRWAIEHYIATGVVLRKCDVVTDRL